MMHLPNWLNFRDGRFEEAAGRPRADSTSADSCTACVADLLNSSRCQR